MQEDEKNGYVHLRFNAGHAAKRAMEYINDGYELSDVLTIVNAHASRGEMSAWVRTPSEFTIAELVKLGFKIENSSSSQLKMISW